MARTSEAAATPRHPAARLRQTGGILLALWVGLAASGCGGESALDAITSSGTASALAEAGVAENFALLDHQGRHRELHYHGDAAAIVIMVHGSGCPIVRASLPALDRLVENYGSREVVFWMLNANPQDSRSAIANEAEEWGIDWPILVDEAQLVSSSLGIDRTGEVLVIDPETWRIVYRGGLDDRLDYEVQRAAPRRRPVAEVLDAILAGGDPSQIESLPVRGCLILDAAAEEPMPAYAETVAPILIERCAGCHRPGGVGPWAMTDHATVRGWSPMMREVIRTRRMPPWHADPQVGVFSGAFALSAEESRALVRWIEAGAPRAAGEVDPLARSVTAQSGEWPLGEPDLILDLPPQTIPESGLLDYRYVDLEVPAGGELWVQAVDLRPSNRTVLHHALAHVIYPEGHPKRSQHWQNEMFAGYAPGIDVYPFPPETGRIVPAGATIRVELHYITTGRREQDRPRLGIYLGDQRPRYELHTRGPAERGLAIPPGDGDYRVEVSYVLPQDAVLYAFLPHMHYRGSWIRYEARFPDGSHELLMSVPSYRFTWQRYYVLAEPRALPSGTEIVVSGGFDNSPRNPRNPDPSRLVRWGPQSIDEMFIGYMDYAFRPIDGS